MRFLSRIMGLVSEGSRIRPQRRSGSRTRSPIELQRLEGRDLLSIAGVSLNYGVLAIQAPKASGNSAVVQMVGSNVQVTLNGASETFSPSLVASITYMGGSGGGDTFTDDTSVASLEYGYGSGNNFTGGTGNNYAYFYGKGTNSNTFNAQVGGVSDVIEWGGKNTVKVNTNGADVQIWWL
jgi:hypothetical protein